MVKRTYYGNLAGITLDAGAATPLFRQLYLSLRAAILSQRVLAGERLPATRTLAARLKIARNTVIGAYEQLHAEGYLESRVGAGTIVAGNLPIDAPLPASRDAAHAARGAGPAESPRRPPARRAQSAIAFVNRLHLRGAGAFEIDSPALDAFPLETVRRVIAARLRGDFRGLLADSDPAGSALLRRAIADWAWSARGIACTAEQVVVTAGGQHSIDLLARALIEPGSVVVTEDPGEPFVRTLFECWNARVVAIPVDDEGLVVEELERRVRGAHLVHITPSNHYPLGGTLPMARRVALLSWARRAGALIVEDDCDSEFRYASRPLAALKGLDGAGQVVYVGTFSRILLPSLRLGYMILPADLVEPVLAVRALADRHPPPLEQAMVAEFMLKGHFSAHVRRMRKLYADRQRVLMEALGHELSHWIELQPAGAGMHVIGWLPPDADDIDLARRAAARGVIVRPISLYYHARTPRPGLLIGHSAVTSGQLRSGIRILKQVLSEALSPGERTTL
jgi:GntR family transcriptional regulator/MocR family aminotransferase